MRRFFYLCVLNLLFIKSILFKIVLILVICFNQDSPTYFFYGKLFWLFCCSRNRLLNIYVYLYQSVWVSLYSKYLSGSSYYIKMKILNFKLFGQLLLRSKLVKKYWYVVKDVYNNNNNSGRLFNLRSFFSVCVFGNSYFR